MIKKKSDRRVKYTKMVIKDSFVKILKNKPINKTTIKEICDEADINRATFYSHYSDQYDLLSQIEAEILENVDRYLTNYSASNMDNTQLKMVEQILEYIQENSELFDLLLNVNGDTKFQQEVIKILGEKHFVLIIGEKSIDTANAEYIFHFLVSGSVGIIQKWLREGLKEPVKEIAEIILSLILNGI